MNEPLNPEQVGNKRTIRTVSYVLLFLMMVCFIMAIDSFIQSLLPDWHSGIISGILLFIVLDRLYTYHNFKSLTLFSLDWAKTVGAQWIVVIVLIRLLLSYANGPDAVLSDLSLFARGDVDAFFTADFIVTLLLALSAWYLPGQFLGLLDEIGMDQELASRDSSASFSGNLLPAHKRMINLIFPTGIILVLLAGLASAIQRSSTTVARLSGGEVGAVLYFLLALGLLSHSRLISLQTRWFRQHVRISSIDLPRRWGVYSVGFLVFLLVVISLLPSGDSLGLFALLSTLLNFLVGIILLVAQLLFFLGALILSIPALFFKQPLPLDQLIQSPPLTPFVPEESVVPVLDNSFWLVAKSVLLWGGLAAIVIFSLLIYMRQRGGLVETLRKTRFVNFFILAWEWLISNANSASKGLSIAISDGWQNIRTRLESRRVSPPSSWFSFRALDPRRQVYFFYLAMIRRSNEQGLSRKPSQTPSEYSAMLENAVPDVEDDIDRMTDTFIKARYSRDKVDPGEVNIVKTAWGHIRRALSAQFKKK